MRKWENWQKLVGKIGDIDLKRPKNGRNRSKLDQKNWTKSIEALQENVRENWRKIGWKLAENWPAKPEMAMETKLKNGRPIPSDKVISPRPKNREKNNQQHEKNQKKKIPQLNQ